MRLDQIASIPLILSILISVFISRALELTLANTPTLGGFAEVRWKNNAPSDRRGFLVLRNNAGDKGTVFTASNEEIKAETKSIPINEAGTYHIEALAGQPPKSKDCDLACRSSHFNMGSTREFVVLAPEQTPDPTKSHDTSTTASAPSISTSDPNQTSPGVSSEPTSTQTNGPGQEQISTRENNSTNRLPGGLVNTSPHPTGSFLTDSNHGPTGAINPDAGLGPQDRNPSGGSSGPNQGTIIGAVVGSIIFAIIAAILLVLCRRRTRRRDTQIFSEKVVWNEGSERFHHSRSSTAMLDDLPKPDPLGNAFAPSPYNQQPVRQSRSFPTFTLPKITHTPPTPSVSSANTNRFSFAKFSKKPLPSPLAITPEIFNGRAPSPPPTDLETPYTGRISSSRTARQLEIQEKIIELQRKLLGMQKWVRRLSGGSAMTASSDGTVTENEDFTRVRRKIEELEILMNSAWALGRSDVVPRAMLEG